MKPAKRTSTDKSKAKELHAFARAHIYQSFLDGMHRLHIGQNTFTQNNILECT